MYVLIGRNNFIFVSYYNDTIAHVAALDTLRHASDMNVFMLVFISRKLGSNFNVRVLARIPTGTGH